MTPRPIAAAGRLTLVLGRTSLSAADCRTPRATSLRERWCHRLTGVGVRSTEDDGSSVETRSNAVTARQSCSKGKDDRRITPPRLAVNLSHAAIASERLAAVSQQFP
jgi:hypothetical protein